MLVRSTLALITSLATAALGCAPMGVTPAPRAAEAPATAHAPPEPQHVYRLDFVVATGEAGHPSSGAYTLNVEERHSGEIHVGSNVLLSTNARQDVGMLLRCHVEAAGEDLLLHSNAEMSLFEEPSTIRKLTASSDALVALGKPALVASVDDPVAHRHYQLTVTATRLR
jgi:hypothetical protein